MIQLVAQQRSYFNKQSTKDLAFRLKQLKKLENLLKENELLLFDAIFRDFKKSDFETYVTELALIYQDIREVRKNLRSWARVKKVKTNLLNFPSKSYIIPEPLGVCLIISAWNYPYLLSLSPVVAAMAAGNTIILKPSEISSSASAALAKIINDNFEASYFKVVEGGIPETTDLLEQKFNKIFFTGSTRVGKIIYQSAAKNLTPVTLELGGKSPAFITEGCNLKMTVKRLIWAKFLNAGQTCIAPDYIMVHASLENEFLKLAKNEIEKQNFSIENQNYTQIIDVPHLNRLKDLLDDQDVYCGGTIDEKERVIAPTIAHNVSFDHPIMKSEIFGPILPVITFESLEDAIAKVKTLPEPLACYVFSKSKKQKQKILKEITFGAGAVNEAVMQITNTEIPYGGIGNSGIGKYHGKMGFDTFSNYKGVLDKPTWLELPLKYYPHTKWKLQCIKRVMKF